MSSKLNRLCAYPWCSKIVESGYCDKHAKAKRQASDRLLGALYSRVHNKWWQKYRVVFIQRNPLCIRFSAEDINSIDNRSRPYLHGQEVLIFGLMNMP
ncbi:hypothetical protein SAMN02745751_01269 [Dethiosulfatibacter aminovorans DSM 17477]|uniref:Uncharacterized protein n=1 Tax=Dethiosulfatibacter aminovorans DSM 17477 TaxID=1121476 RepID=A0A1M6EPD4_9FIRM|nr:hypothetical protein SAMN02745751_01269 [Dethiosulfatibacter aminovorans DSM 17477]